MVVLYLVLQYFWAVDRGDEGRRQRCQVLKAEVVKCWRVRIEGRGSRNTNTQSFMQLVYIVWGLSKYIETKPQTTYFYLTLGIFIKQKKV